MTKRLIVFNITDGIPASPHPFKTRLEAQKFIIEFRKRYEKQGYYFTSKMTRIKPEEVKLKIVPFEGIKL